MTPEDFIFKIGYYVLFVGLAVVSGGLGMISAAFAISLIRELLK